MKLKFFVTAIFSLILGAALVSDVRAGKAMDQIRETSDRLLAVLNDESLQGPEREAERNRILRGIIAERFDWEEFSRRALARHWRDQTNEDRQEFVSLFSSLLEQTYKDQVAKHDVNEILYDAEEMDGNYGQVRVRIVTSENKEYPVNYRVMMKNNEWFVYDVSVEGISLVSNYRVQFRDILRNQSFQDLLQRLKEKINSLEKGTK